MSDNLTFGVKMDGSGNLVGEAKAARAEIENLKKSTDDLGTSALRLNDAQKNSATGWTTFKGNADQYMAAVRATTAMHEAAAEKIYVVNNAYLEAAKGADISAHANAGVTRELMVLGHEAMTGNFSRMPGTMMVLASRVGGIGEAFAALMPWIGAVALAAAAGATVWETYGININKLRENLDALDGDLRLKETKALEKLAANYTKLAEEKRASASSGGIGWTKDAQAAAMYTEQLRKVNAQLDANTRSNESGGMVGWDLALTAPTAKKREIAEQIDQLTYFHNLASTTAQSRLDAESKVAELQKRLVGHVAVAPKVKIDPNDTAVIALQTEAFKKEMEAMGVSAEQTKVYELAMHGATTAQINNAQAMATRIDEINAENEAVKRVEEATKAMNAESAHEITALDKSIEAQKLHNAEIGKTAEQRDLAKQQIYDEATAQMQADADMTRSMAQYAGEFQSVYIDRANALDIEIAKRKELAALIGSAAVLEANAAAAKKSAEEWKKASDEIERSLTDALMRGFESGKSFGQNFIDSLKHSLETAALKVVVQAMVNPIMGGVQSMATGGSFMGGMGNAGSLFSAGSNLYSSVGSLFASGGGMASMAGSTAVMSSAYAAPAIATAAGEAAGAAAASGAASAAIGTAMPYVAAAYLAYSMLNSNSGTYAQGTGYRMTGQFGPRGISGNSYALASNNGENYADVMPDGLAAAGGAAAQKTFETIRASVAKSATLLGVQDAAAKLATVSIPFNVTIGMDAAGRASAMQQAAIDAAGSLAQKLIPQLRSYSLENESLTQTFVRLSQEQMVVDGGLKRLNMTLGITGASAITARSELASVASGLTNLSGKMDFFYTNFFTDTERRSTQMAALNDTFAQLGITSIPQTNSQFRALVQAQDLTTAAGRGMFAALLNLAPAFDQVTKLTDSLNGSLQSLSTDMFASKIEYDRLIGRIGGGSATAPTTNAELVAELKAMRAELAALRSSSESTAASTRKTSDLLRNVTQDGNSLLTTPA